MLKCQFWQWLHNIHGDEGNTLLSLATSHFVVRSSTRLIQDNEWFAVARLHFHELFHQKSLLPMKYSHTFFISNYFLDSKGSFIWYRLCSNLIMNLIMLVIIFRCDHKGWYLASDIFKDIFKTNCLKSDSYFTEIFLWGTSWYYTLGDETIY